MLVPGNRNEAHHHTVPVFSVSCSRKLPGEDGLFQLWEDGLSFTCVTLSPCVGEGRASVTLVSLVVGGSYDPGC